MKTCSKCGQDFKSRAGLGPCSKCFVFYNRLKRILEKHKCEDERRQWYSLTRNERQAFFIKWRDEPDYNDVKRAISETIVESKSKRATSTKGYIWLDDFQLRKRYKGKEEQIEKVKTNAESCWCRVRGVMLWADPECTSSEVASKKSSGKRELSTSQQISRSHKKKPKADPAPKTEPGPAPKPPRLTGMELQTLAQEKTNLVELLGQVKLTNHIANLPEFAGDIPKIYIDPLKHNELVLLALIETVDDATESGICDYKHLQETMCAARAQVILGHAKLKQSIADAEKP